MEQLCRLEAVGGKLRELSRCPPTFNDAFNSARADIIQLSRGYGEHLGPDAVAVLGGVIELTSTLRALAYEVAVAKAADIVRFMSSTRTLVGDISRRHKSVAVHYKRLHDNVANVARACALEEESQRRQAAELADSASSKMNWARGLGLLPGVGALVSIPLSYSSTQDMHGAVGHHRYAHEAHEAATATKYHMEEAAAAFEAAFDGFAGQLAVVESSCCTALGRAQSLSDNQKKAHWKLFQGEAARLQNLSQQCSTVLRRVVNQLQDV